ncbi:ABC transporter ATP-binding protein/permease [Arthrobacter sp. I2-34]|uniref:ABC transporter ATP-binding protein/permease n=1 Tax=Arthrobacter hankyongi TaxID=2904801 RepID=A0ABS9L5U9_9MICC|nr:ABC transporter ATP-binding protein [Arthrobacter hankyongi]MCG2622045.1 ABC transporter ATP-binding protein/permease [Arthrobacter hankyongi]
MSMMRGGFRGMQAGQQTARPLNFLPSLRRILALMRPDLPAAAAMAGAAALAVALSVAAPRILGAATDIIFAGLAGRAIPAGVSQAEYVQRLRSEGKEQLADMLQGMHLVPGQGIDFDQLRMVLLTVICLYLAAFVFGWLQGRLSAVVVQHAMFRLRAAIEDKLARLPMAHFQRESRGDVLSRATNDIDNLAQTLNQTLTQIMVSVLTILGVLAMMVSISPLLALIAVATVPVSAIVTVLIARRSQALFATQWRTTGRLNGHVEEMITGHDVVKAFGQQPQAIAEFRSANEQLYAAAYRAQFVSGMVMPAMMLVSNLNYVAVAVTGGLQVAFGLLSIGSVQAFIQYSRQFSQPLGQLGGLVGMLQSGVASAERVFALLDSAEEAPDAAPAATGPATAPAADGTGTHTRGQGRVAFEDVSFGYGPDAEVIHRLSFTAESGQTVAIVGPTGAGKTTLVNLLLRFYDVDAGRITLDGADITTLPRRQLRRNFGMVLQDAWLFGGTIRENLAYGAPEATDEQIMAAARATQVDHFVRALPEGYDTVLEDGGSRLSQGQRQLMTIARAWLADPAVLVLDEATSSVDTRTEAQIRQALASLRRDRTSFVIAHRLSTIRDADVILVMRDGRIVEQGRHQGLLAAGGFYADLYRSQFAGPLSVQATAEREQAAGHGS